jgi:hypothetical protein
MLTRWPDAAADCRSGITILLTWLKSPRYLDMILTIHGTEIMKSLGIFLGGLTMAVLAFHPAFALVAPGPAPLLAAGIPAFAALGGGVAVTKLVNRFRRKS